MLIKNDIVLNTEKFGCKNAFLYIVQFKIKQAVTSKRDSLFLVMRLCSFSWNVFLQ